MFSIAYFPYTQVLAVLIMFAICFFEKYIAKYKKILFYFSVICMALYPLLYMLDYFTLNYFDIIGIANIFLWLSLLFAFKFKKYRFAYIIGCSVVAIIFYFLFCSMHGTPILFCWTISAMYVILLFYKFIYCEAKKIQKNRATKFTDKFEKIKKRYINGEITEAEYKKLRAELLRKI